MTDPVAKTGMLIRRPVAEVFEAFIDPAITSRFWFTSGSGRLEAGKRVTWEWAMYGVSGEVNVLAVEEPTRILVEWPSAGGLTTVGWVFTPLPDDTTFVEITNSGFSGSDEEIVAQALDAMGGFTLVLAGLKAWLEHGIALNLVADRHPALAADG
jgi:uncharacterized protein YndB with AHSA1/START domain